MINKRIITAKINFMKKYLNDKIVNIVESVVAIGLVVFTIVSTIILAFIMYMLPIAIPVIAVCYILKWLGVITF